MTRPPLSAMLTLIAALGILAVIAITTAIPPNDQVNPSSRSAGTLGTLALYTWYSNLGLNVDRLTGTFDLTRSDVVVCYDPTVALTDADVDAVMTFLRSGGDLVLVVTSDSLAAAAPLLRVLEVNPSASAGSGVATVAQPFDSTDRVRTVPVESGLTFSDAGASGPDAHRARSGRRRDGARGGRRPRVRPR